MNDTIIIDPFQTACDHVKETLEKDLQIIRNLEKMLQDMKCCGNCANNGAVQNEGIMREENCRIGNHADSSCKGCTFWEFDGLSKLDRRIEG
jgi:hypothetical protein